MDYQQTAALWIRVMSGDVVYAGLLLVHNQTKTIAVGLELIRFLRPDRFRLLLARFVGFASERWPEPV